MKGEFKTSVNDREWKDFPAFGEDGLFEIRTTRSSIDAVKLRDGPDKNVPYITRSDINNGISRFVSSNNSKGLEDPGGTITIGLDTQTAFFQPYPYITGQNIHVVSGEKLTEGVARFLTVILQNQMRSKFNWGGNGATIGRMKRLRILLPVNDLGEPDYEFMEEFVRERDGHAEGLFRSYQRQDLTDTSIPPLSERKWGEFFVDDIFEIRPGKRLETRNKNPGLRPFIGASEINNGVTGFVSNINESLDSNCLGVNYNGAPCTSFYHLSESLFSDDVKHLHLKNHEDNEWILLFFSTLFAKQKVKFNYGYKCNEQRMRRQILMLPVNDSGEPDYDYMECYARNLLAEKYRKYLDYLRNRECDDRKRCCLPYSCNVRSDANTGLPGSGGDHPRRDVRCFKC